MTISVTGYQDKTIEARGLRFHYLEWGDAAAPPMIVLHGLTGLAHMWDVFCDAFQDDYHIFCLDQRGHGDTQWPDPPSFAGDDYVEDVAALAGLWGAQRFVLVGLSMGAHNTLGFASKYPDRVVKAVPIDIPPAMNRMAAANNNPNERRGAEQPPQMEFDSVEEMVAATRQNNQIASDDMIRHRVTNNARQKPGRQVDLEVQPGRAPPLAAGGPLGAPAQDHRAHSGRARRCQQRAAPGRRRKRGGRDPERAPRRHRRLRPPCADGQAGRAGGRGKVVPAGVAALQIRTCRCIGPRRRDLAFCAAAMNRSVA